MKRIQLVIIALVSMGSIRLGYAVNFTYDPKTCVTGEAGCYATQQVFQAQSWASSYPLMVRQVMTHYPVYDCTTGAPSVSLSGSVTCPNDTGGGVVVPNLKTPGVVEVTLLPPLLPDNGAYTQQQNAYIAAKGTLTTLNAGGVPIVQVNETVGGVPSPVTCKGTEPPTTVSGAVNAWVQALIKDATAGKIPNVYSVEPTVMDPCQITVSTDDQTTAKNNVTLANLTTLGVGVAYASSPPPPPPTGTGSKGSTPGTPPPVLPILHGQNSKLWNFGNASIFVFPTSAISAMAMISNDATHQYAVVIGSNTMAFIDPLSLTAMVCEMGGPVSSVMPLGANAAKTEYLLVGGSGDLKVVAQPYEAIRKIQQDMPQNFRPLDENIQAIACTFDAWGIPTIKLTPPAGMTMISGELFENRFIVVLADTSPAQVFQGIGIPNDLGASPTTWQFWDFPADLKKGGGHVQNMAAYKNPAGITVEMIVADSAGNKFYASCDLAAPPALTCTAPVSAAPEQINKVSTHRLEQMAQRNALDAAFGTRLAQTYLAANPILDLPLPWVLTSKVGMGPFGAVASYTDSTGKASTTVYSPDGTVNADEKHPPADFVMEVNKGLWLVKNIGNSASMLYVVPPLAAQQVASLPGETPTGSTGTTAAAAAAAGDAAGVSPAYAMEGGFGCTLLRRE